MFYKEEDISVLAKCPLCSLLYSDPRVLPCCGETVCYECIQHNKQTNQIECSFCAKKYPMPVDGFLVNKTIEKLLSAMPGEINQCNPVKELREKLQSLDQNIHKFQAVLQHRPDKIKEYCLDLKRQVDLEAERHIEMIHTECEHLKEQIRFS